MNYIDKYRPDYDSSQFIEILKKYKYNPKIGDILIGIVMGFEQKHIILDIGLPKMALLPYTEINVEKVPHPEQLLKLKDLIEVTIVGFQRRQFLVSLKKTHYLYLWERIKQMDYARSSIYGKNVESTRYGKILDFEGLNVFVPNSHLPRYYRKKVYKKEFLPVKFIYVNTRIEKLLVSSRLALLQKQNYLLDVGMIKMGCVSKVVSFGLFINIHGIKCLLHISEIANKRIVNIKDSYKRGTHIKVKIIYYSISQGRIALSSKRL